MDEEGGLSKYHFRWRDYDPELGGWFVVDPAKQYLSLYVFGGNNSINGFEFDGRSFWDDLFKGFGKGMKWLFEDVLFRRHYHPNQRDIPLNT